MAARLWGPHSALVLAIAALVFGLDQTFKWWMLSVFGIADRQPVQLLPVFDLVLVWNKGVSYGLFSSHQQGALIGLAVVISVLLWIWSCRTSSRLTAWALALVIGGALANALDRAILGAVADFFYFHVGSFSWYVFNIADMAIVAGVALLLYESFTSGQAEGRRGNA
jgi:signal peptidase II